MLGLLLRTELLLLQKSTVAATEAYTLPTTASKDA